FDELRDSLCRRIVAKQSYRPVTVREEVDLVADPHWINVVGVRTRNLLGAQVAEVGYPQVARFPASIPFPGHKALGSPAKLAAVGREHRIALDPRSCSQPRCSPTVAADRP